MDGLFLDGLFVKQSEFHHGFPLYLNEHGNHLYYWRKVQQWQVGLNSMFENRGVQLRGMTVGCPDEMNNFTVVTPDNGWVVVESLISKCAQGKHKSSF